MQVHLLEVNPGPDFKQTGGRLQGLIADLWEGTLRIVLDDGDGRLGEAAALANDRHPMGSGFTKVYDKEASVNRLGGGMTFTK